MDAKTLGEAMGWTLTESRYAQLLPAYLKAMQWAGITTVERAAMFAAQLGHESVGLKYQSEIWGPSAQQRTYDGRMGNRPGTDDWSRFRGHGWIQITGRDNHTAVSKWAHGKGIVPTPSFFVDYPERLGDDTYCWVGPAWYWTAARPQLNSLSDARNLDAATRAINGGLNGIDDRLNRYNRALRMGARLLGGPVAEKVLDYPRDQVVQDTGWNCGPASVQTAIRAAGGPLILERDLARELGTHQGGTDWIGQFPAVLNRHIPGAQYRSVEMPNDPPTPAQRDRLWNDIVSSINAGHGVVVNIVAPPSNYPRGVNGSVSPAYGGGTVYHYFLAAGYSDSGGRRVWIADSGFSPYGYWISFDQLATLVPPKGYAYSATPAAKPATSGGITVSEADRIINFIKGYVAPIGSDVKDVRQQITGGRDAGEYPGWAQLGKDSEGRNLTLVDAVAALRRDLDNLRKEIK